jgi:RND family efflux transporter MFP subunit
MKKKQLFVGGSIVGVVLLILFFRIGRSANGSDTDPAGSGAPSPAAVATVERKTLQSSLVIAGEFKPFQEVDVHAKVAGYLRTIYVDVGDHVKEGQILAVLEIPELSAELAGADATVHRAEEEILRAQSNLDRLQSAHSTAHSAYTRLKQASEARSGLVAQQELDDAQGKDLESEAQVVEARAALSASQHQLRAARANQKQLQALSDYSRITAPFDGVVTKRFADTGALIQSGTSSNTQTMPIVRLAQISKLRLVLPIPESVAAQIHVGDVVSVFVQALNQEFKGSVSRFADSLDRQTRTMETEIDMPNRDGRLITGMYAETHLTLRSEKEALTIPLEAVSRAANSATVLEVNARNIVEERQVKLGLEDGARVQILDGLSEGDRVVIGDRSKFRNGQTIQPNVTSSMPSGEAH